MGPGSWLLQTLRYNCTCRLIATQDGKLSHVECEQCRRLGCDAVQRDTALIRTFHSLLYLSVYIISPLPFLGIPFCSFESLFLLSLLFSIRSFLKSNQSHYRPEVPRGFQEVKGT